MFMTRWRSFGYDVLTLLCYVNFQVYVYSSPKTGVRYSYMQVPSVQLNTRNMISRLGSRGLHMKKASLISIKLKNKRDEYPLI